MISKKQNSKDLQKAQGISKPFSLQKRLYDIHAAAEYLGRSSYSVRTLIWADKLPYVKDGKKQYLDIYDMERYIEKNKVTTI